MTGSEYQLAAMGTRAGDLSPREYLANAALGLCGESGEVADLIKKHLHQGHDLPVVKVLSELGDIMWYVALMCEETGVTMDLVMEMNLQKLRDRYGERFSVEASINRAVA